MSRHCPRRSGRPCDAKKREAILSAAIRAFFEHGYTGATIEAIAADASVSKVTVYKHFHDKDGLFAAAVEAECEKIRTPLLDGDGKGPLAERLVRFGMAMNAFLSRPELVKFERRLAAEIEHLPHLGECFLEAGPRRCHRTLSDLLRNASVRGELDIDDPILAADQLSSMFKGMGDLERRFATQQDPASVEKRIHAAVDMFMRSYGARECAR
ncbi:MAG: TetR/AcrR family transcriptional regulator [Novosphingobium sp.]|nr:TetR/AcrR family transcriptional regulator [Novosphingobium sp.]MCP5401550.1 TetR/AcrR family transcriptional regulator [Novosphingobium sp.]